MTAWTSWMVLAVCTVITQSFPHPDEYQIPVVPSDKRVQYYVLHDDGNFKYGYDTGEGTYETAVKMGSGELTGFFGYNDPFGQKIRVDYTAGTQGFLPTGNSLPVAPESSVGTALPRTASQVLLKSAPQTSFVFEESNVNSVNNIDGSYSFSYDNSDSSRRESADSSNNVVGEYSFVADDGKNRKIRYRAGAATGYVAEGDSIPVAPAAPSTPVVRTVAQPPPATLYNAPVRSQPSTLYATPAQSASVRTGSASLQTFEPRGDASYSFSYQNEDSAREESADSDLNVRGRFSFVADDGVQRTVNYRAGSDIGFVAVGAHLPVAPKVPRPAVTSSGSAATQYSATRQAAPAPVAVAPQVYSTEPRGDASYQFSYQTGDSSRSESADSDLNVKGDYSFIADDGQLRTVNYIAGSSTGFVAQGDHLPVAPEAPAPSVHAAAPQTAPATLYSAPQAAPATLYSAPQQSSGTVAHQPRGDASYSFNYQTGESTRSESADSDLNVRGEYSFIGDDGVERTVNYIAGSGTGFVAVGDHLPVAGAAPVSPAFTSANSYSSGAAQPQSAVGSSASFRSGQSEDAHIVSTRGNDGSYSFSYVNSDSSRSETADASNNVVGEYSYVADDGQTRKIQYQAGSATGFLAQGDSIPVAPEVPVVVDVGRTLPAAPATFYGAPVQTPIVPSFSSAPTSPVRSHEDANIISNIGQGGAYSFSYTNSDSSRSESADASNNVVGQYSYVADDGKNREIRYRAGSGIGFVAEGDSIPVAPEVPSVPAPAFASASPAPVIPATLYSAPVQPSSAGSAGQQTFEPRGDASYSFSYQNDDSAREETADSDLNVKGRFSFVGDDGVQRSVNYIAGSATGFVAEGAHLPVAPAVPSVGGGVSAPAQPTAYSGASFSNVATSSGVSSPASRQRGDASYSFNYVADGSSRDETADRDLNVKGRFSFVADDGIERTVNYIAGSGTGFVAEGAHLPVPVADDTSATFRQSGSSTSSSSSFTSSGASSSAGSAVGVPSAVGGYSYQAPTGPQLTSRGSSSFTRSGASSSTAGSSSSGFTSQIVGNVLLNQYGPGRSKFGYVYTEI